MDSVERWSKANGYHYEFYDDSFLGKYPRELNQNCHICVKTDLIRLKHAIAALENENYQRVIWCDADLLIFNQKFTIPDKDFILCREQFIHSVRETFGTKVFIGGQILNQLGKYHKALRPIRKTINNSIFSCNHNGLDIIKMLLAVTETTIRRSPNIGRLDAGTVIFSYMKEFFPFQLIEEVALVSRSKNVEKTAKKILDQEFKAANISNSSNQDEESYQILCNKLLLAQN